VLAWARLTFLKPAGCGAFVEGIRIVLNPKARRIRAMWPKVYVSKGYRGTRLQREMPFIALGGKMQRLGEWVVYEYLRSRGLRPNTDKKWAIDQMLEWIDKQRERDDVT